MILDFAVITILMVRKSSPKNVNIDSVVQSSSPQAKGVGGRGKLSNPQSNHSLAHDRVELQSWQTVFWNGGGAAL